MEHDALARKWLGKLTRLNPATGRNQCRGKAPHKPLLLLCLVDMVEAGELQSRMITRTPGLVLRFKNYGALVSGRWPSRLDLRLPFYHLKTQGFWSAFAVNMEPAQSPESCFACELHSEFSDLLGDPDFRLKARLLLISTYFEPGERVALLESLGLTGAGKPSADGQIAALHEEVAETERRKGRSARFAVQVVSQYKYTCALTGICLVTMDGSTIVEAAHIEPWSESQNDDLRNGLALSRNAHWAFDEGLWSVRPDHRIVVATNRFTEQAPESLRLACYDNRLLQFAAGVTLRPDDRYFVSHRRYHGLSEKVPRVAL